MTNKPVIHYSCSLNIPQIEITFNEKNKVVLQNHSDTEIELEPGRYSIRAVYSLLFGESRMDFDKTIDAVVEEGFNYEAKICLILKVFSLVKVYPKGSRA